MADPPPTRCLILGVGNAYRRDDGVGPHVASALAAHGLPAQVHPGDGAALIERFAEADHVLLVDATNSGGAPGTLVRIDARKEPVPAEFFHYSTHRFGLAEAVETSRALGGLPPRLVIYGIEGAAFEAGPGLSPAVSASAEALINRILRAAARLRLC